MSRYQDDEQLREAVPQMAARNKTEVTLRVTEQAAAWLQSLGAKAIETEVPVGPKWIADLAAFWVPTPTEAQRTKLIAKRPPYYLPGGLETSPELNRKWEEWRQSYADLPFPVTIVHEVKTSVQDFKRDTKWARPPVADMRVLSLTKDVLEAASLPDGWWVLLHGSDGRLHRVLQRAPMPGITDTQRLLVVANIAERRHNRTANAFFADLQKKRRIEDQRYLVESRVSKCLSTVLKILRGEQSVEEALTRNLGHAHHLPAYMVEDLKRLHGKLPNAAES